MFASTIRITDNYHDSTKRGKIYDFARLFGGGIDSTILGEMDRLCSLTIERSLSTLLWIH